MLLISRMRRDDGRDAQILLEHEREVHVLATQVHRRIGQLAPERREPLALEEPCMSDEVDDGALVVVAGPVPAYLDHVGVVPARRRVGWWRIDVQNTNRSEQRFSSSHCGEAVLEPHWSGDRVVIEDAHVLGGRVECVRETRPYTEVRVAV